MMNSTFRLSAFIGVLALSTLTALAQQVATVGDLLDAGGKKLSRAEIAQLFSGGTITGTAMGAPGSTFRLSYKADGSATGEGSSPAGSSAIVGKWSANDRDLYCQDLKTAQGMPIQGCFPYFRLGDRLFAAPGEQRAAPVYERKLTR